jgi:hypothetical protein
LDYDRHHDFHEVINEEKTNQAKKIKTEENMWNDEREYYLNLQLKAIFLEIQVDSFDSICNTSSCWDMIIFYHNHVKQTHPMISTSTNYYLYNEIYHSLLTKFHTKKWSLIKVTKWFRIQTAHLSNKRKHGAVFLVSNIYAGDAASAIACGMIQENKW